MNERPMTHDDALDLAAGYVLGALEPAEEAAVRDHLATCLEPHAAFVELGGVVPSLLADVPLVEPPAALRGRIMDAARADLALRRPTPDAAATGPVAFPNADERALRRARRTGRLDWALRIAAVIAIVAIGAWGFGLQRQLDAARQFDQAVANVLDAAGQPGAQAVILGPAQGKHGSGIAAVAPDGTTTLAMRDLPATSDGQVYTTWVIVGKNAPTAVADFTVDANGIASVRTRPAQTPPGAVLAVTLEPNAGNTAPKGPVISSGTAPGTTG
ncbi:MAG TPA: anti-sigma factor [Candidatus Bathyarchaeia archaeon]|nr:anti-sigma factor [Candidatus Bathyarchaeia archaeon]